MAGVDAIRAGYASAGQELYPVRSMDEALSLMEAGLAVPAHVPDRGDRIKARLHSLGSTLARGAASSLASLADKIGMSATAQHILASQPPPDNVVLLTEREVCVVPGCHGHLIVASNGGSRTQAAHPILYTQSGVKKAELLEKRCCNCSALHYFSYATGGNLLSRGFLQPYSDCVSQRYIHFTSATVWEVALLRQYSHQLLHGHVSARAFENIYAASQRVRLPDSWRKRMAHAWYAMELLRRLSDTGTRIPLGPYGTVEGVDIMVMQLKDALTLIFVRTWGQGHSTRCRSPWTCVGVVIDGHMKCKRVVCANKFARIVDAGALGTVVLPCDKTPCFRSRWCADCRDSGAVRGSAGTERVGIDLPAGSSAEATASGDDPFSEGAAERPAVMDHDVFLVEDVLGERATTISREGDAHRACARRRV